MLQKFYNEEKLERINKYTLYILLFMMLMIPIVTYKYITMSYSPKFMNNFYRTGEKTDVFNFFKTLILYVSTAGIFGMFMYRVIELKEEIKKSKLNIFLGIFAVGIVLSAFISDYKDIALFGNFDRHEGALAWFCYITIFFVLYNIEIEEKYYKLFYFMLIPFLVINSILGVLNLYGINILQSKVVQFIIGGHGTIQGQLWTTLYNPNFSGGIAGVIFSISFIYLLLEEDRSKKLTILLGTILSFIIVLTSKSVSGFITVVATLPLVLLIGWKFSKKKDAAIWSIVTMATNVAILIFMSKYDHIVYDETIGIFDKINGISPFIIPIILFAGIFIIILSKCINPKKVFMSIVIIFSSALLILGIFYYRAVENIEKQLAMDKNAITFQDSDWFDKLDTMSNGRIPIWTEVLKVINDKPVLGHGFDTLPYVLDHNQYQAKQVEKIGSIVTVDKPHNMILEIFYGSGLIGLVGFIGIIWYLIKKAFYNYADNVNDKFLYISIIGVISFLIQGMLNDTFVGTSIILWIFAGICANRLTVQSNENIVYVD